jgi:hypothetical protein
MLGSTQVLLGGQPIPLQYVSPTTIYAQIPYSGVPTNTSQQLIVLRADRISDPETIVIAPQFAVIPLDALTQLTDGSYSLRCAGLGEVEGEAPRAGATAGRAHPTKLQVTVKYRITGEPEWRTATTISSELSRTVTGEYNVVFRAPELTGKDSEFMLVTAGGLKSAVVRSSVAK